MYNIDFGETMKKLLLITVFASTFAIAYPTPETKQKKLEELFILTNDKQTIGKVWEPMFASVNITEEKVKKNAVDKFFENIKKDFISAYDKFFNETDIDEMLKYNRTPTGKKFLSVSLELNMELQKAYNSMMTIIQDLLPKPETTKEASKNVVHFDAISKDKKDAEARDLFNKELKHDGLTVVKFSASWCGPCKRYAPDFEKVAEELKEVVVDGKKVAIKYIQTDIDANKTLAQDYSVVSVPATIFYKNGKKIDSQTGYMTPHALSTKIKELAK